MKKWPIVHWEPETLREADVSESEGRVIRNVVFLRPGETLDKRRLYPESTLAEAAPLFSSTRLWRGHGSVEERRGMKERDPLDVLGVASDAKVDANRQGALVGMVRLAQAQEKRRVITISEVTIVGRIQKPIAAVDVSRIQPKLTLAELKQPFLDRIEEAVYRDPF